MQETILTSTISPGWCSPPGTTRTRASYQLSQVWATRIEPSAVAFGPTPMGVQATDAEAAASSAALAKSVAEMRFMFFSSL